MEVTTWNAGRIEGEILTIWIKDTKIKSVIGDLGCSPFQKVHTSYQSNDVDRADRQVGYLLENADSEWENQTVESFDWNADVWFSTRFRKIVKTQTEDEEYGVMYEVEDELIGDVDFDTNDQFATNYELGHKRSVFAQMRVWNSNGTLNVGSVIIQPQLQRAVCRYCGAIVTYAQCLDHTNNSEWDSKELFTALVFAHGYSEMSRNPKVTNFAQGEVSIDTKAIWDNYRA